MTAMTQKPRICSMEDPLPEDLEAAIVVAVHNARAFLSDGERSTITVSESIELCEQAAKMLDGAVAMASASSASGPLQNLLSRAMRAVNVAVAHGELARSYISTANANDPPDVSKREVASVSRFQKATEFAKQETHRALAQLAEEFPQSYDTAEEP